MRKAARLLVVLVAAALAAGCAATPKEDPVAALLTAPAGPTPAGVVIKVYTAPDMPKQFQVLGQVSGPTMQALQDDARKMGADAIVVDPERDPISGWVMANAIRVETAPPP